MSSDHHKDNHAQVSEEWESKNIIGLSIDQQILLLEKGIHAIEQRALRTLSSITLMVIFDRVLYQGIEKFDILSEATINNGISIEALIRTDNNLDYKINLIEALRFLLIELLRVLGRITAEILTKPLHYELMNVTFESKEIK